MQSRPTEKNCRRGLRETLSRAENRSDIPNLLGDPKDPPPVASRQRYNLPPTLEKSDLI